MHNDATIFLSHSICPVAVVFAVRCLLALAVQWLPWQLSLFIYRHRIFTHR